MTSTGDRLADKVAIITGAGSGIGRSMALLFASEGAKVVCADISGAEKQTAADIGEAAIGVHVDVAVTADVVSMVEVRRARLRHGRRAGQCHLPGDDRDRFGRRR